MIDGGIQADHVDFEGRVSCVASFLPGVPCESGDFHGTFVAGVAAGKTTGVAKKARIKSVKVCDDAGDCRLGRTMRGIQQCELGRGPRVCNISIAGIGGSTALEMVAIGASRSGAIVVIAAGNENLDACDFTPGRVAGSSAGFVINVGATTINDERWVSSNWGDCVTLFAPGATINSTQFRADGENTSFVLGSGTSFAAPRTCNTDDFSVTLGPSCISQQCSLSTARCRGPCCINASG